VCFCTTWQNGKHENRIFSLNVLHAACRKCRTQKIAKNSPSGHHRTTLSGYIFATKAHIDNREKNLLNSNISPTRPHNMDEIVSLVLSTPANFNGSRVLAALLHDSTGRQRNFAALNRGRHLYLAGRISRWAMAHILVSSVFSTHDSYSRSSISCSQCVQLGLLGGGMV